MIGVRRKSDIQSLSHHMNRKNHWTLTKKHIIMLSARWCAFNDANMTQSLTGSIQKKYEYSDYGQRSLDSKTEINNNEFEYNGEAHTGDGLQYLECVEKVILKVYHIICIGNHN